MKRFFAFLFVMIFLCACVPTPEDDIVVGKNTEHMLATAQQTDVADETALSKLQAPEHYKAELVSTGGHVLVSVDADIKLPNGSLPVVRANSKRFTEEDLRHWTTQLLGDDPYYYDGFLPKSYYRQKLDAALDAIEHWDTYGQNYFNEYDTPEEAREGLSSLYKSLSEAPDEPRRVEPDFSFTPMNRWNDSGKIDTTDDSASVCFVDPSGTYGMIRAMNLKEILGMSEMVYTRDSQHTNPFFEFEIDVQADLSVTREDAETQAKELIASLGFDDFAFVKCYGMNAYMNEPQDYTPVWTCIFTRAFGAAQTTYTSNASGGNGYAAPFQSEVLYVMIDDNGLYYLRYEGPIEVLETVTESAALMPFSEIQTIFERMVVLKDNEADHPLESVNEHTDHYYITEVRLGLVAIREQDKDTALLVPAWDFLGYLERTFPSETHTDYTSQTHSFLTVNAIDGSIIDRTLGY